MCSFSSAVQGYLEQREPISTLKNLRCQSIHFKSTEHSEENNVLHAAASSTDGILREINLFPQLC
jgi:hypothetical protein